MKRTDRATGSAYGRACGAGGPRARVAGLARVAWLALAAVPVLGAVSVPPAAATTRRETVNEFAYVSPAPDSRRVSPANNIAVRDGRTIDPASVSPGTFVVTGTGSGAHSGRTVLSSDRRTLLFLPDVPFAPGERVDVSVAPGVRTSDGASLPRLSFGFQVADALPAGRARLLPPPDGLPRGAVASVEPSGSAVAGVPAACEDLPAGYPGIEVLLADHPAAGNLFLTPWLPAQPGNLIVLDELGTPLFREPRFRLLTDFKVQPNGLLTFYDSRPDDPGAPRYYAMDSTYAVVDSFETGNGYVADNHELQLLPDGHALLMAYDPQPVGMDEIVEHGDPFAVVTGLIVQELDEAKNVVFQWRSWDHFDITDATPTTSLTDPTIDYVHGNSLELDHDGNILLSSRHLNEVTKIDRQTGAVIWRWGMHAVHNEFTFVNDPRGFAQQHDARRLPNGHITLFDNGVDLVPEYSRALEYELDEVHKVATLVWEYRNTPDVFGVAVGNTQRRPDGSTVIGWGGTLTPPKVTEVRADGTKALEIAFDPVGTWTYRALKFPWRTTLLVTGTESVDFGGVVPGGTATRALRVRNGSARDLTIGCAVSTNPAFSVTTPLPLSLSPGQETTLELAFAPADGAAQQGKLYLRMPEGDRLVAQDLWVSGGGNAAPDVSGAFAVESELWPPDRTLRPVRIAGVIDPDGDPVTLTVTGVTQDEPVVGSGTGSGATCPDAAIEDGLASVRAERAGVGNGRVYRIAFTATDGKGGVGEGAVTVCVPHDARRNAACEDDGQVYDALGPCRDGAAAIAPDAGTAPAAPAPAPGITSFTGRAGRARVEYTLPADGPARLSLFDLSGRRVRTLVRGVQRAGRHELEWNTSGLSPGVYFYRLRAGEVSVTREVQILR